MSMEKQRTGRIVRSISGFYDVQAGDAVRVTWAPASAVPVDVEAEEAK